MKQLLSLCAFCAALSAQTTPRQVARQLEPTLQTPELSAYQLPHYLDRKTPALLVPSSAVK